MDHWWTREPCCAMNVVELSYVVEERWTHREQVSPAARSRNRLPDRLIDQSINQGRTRTLVSRQTHASTLHRRQKKRGFFFSSRSACARGGIRRHASAAVSSDDAVGGRGSGGSGGRCLAKYVDTLDLHIVYTWYLVRTAAAAAGARTRR